MTKSRSATASMLFGLARGEAEVARERLAVDREGRAGERRRPERHHVDASRRVAEALAVAREHEHVGEQVVGEQRRAAPAAGACSRAWGARRAPRRAGRARACTAREARVDVPDDVAQIEPLVERDLIVAGAPGVQLAAHRPRELDEPALDVHVDVLELGPEREAARSRSRRGRPPVPRRWRSRSASVSSAGAPERARPRHAALDVVGPQAAVERQRGGERLRRGVRPLGEASGPRLARGPFAGRAHEAPARPGAAASRVALGGEEGGDVAHDASGDLVPLRARDAAVARPAEVHAASRTARRAGARAGGRSAARASAS